MGKNNLIVWKTLVSVWVYIGSLRPSTHNHGFFLLLHLFQKYPHFKIFKQAVGPQIFSLWDILYNRVCTPFEGFPWEFLCCNLISRCMCCSFCQKSFISYVNRHFYDDSKLALSYIKMPCHFQQYYCWKLHQNFLPTASCWI